MITKLGRWTDARLALRNLCCSRGLVLSSLSHIASPISTLGTRNYEQSIVEKYRSKLEQKLKETGLKDIEQLRSFNEERLKNEKLKQRQDYEEIIRAAKEKFRHTKQSDSNSPQNSTKLAPRPSYSSPIKPLDSIVDLSKFLNQSADTIVKLWTAFHLSNSSPNRLGAVIPAGTYRDMVGLAKKYPSFVIPLRKSDKKDSHLNEFEANTAQEMIYLQWDLFCPPTNSPIDVNSSPIPNPVPRESSSTSPTIVMFTPLAEYKLRQSFARPSLILTHYTDLIDSHKIVLMRGDITLSSETGKGLLTATEAQLLVLRLQQFYCSSLSSLKSSPDPIHQARMNLLRKFHETPDVFEISELIDLAKDL
ncbi:ATP11 protein-domain-containing protein [Phakopsora pachyrhizi]|uniref:ATP11 protein-domain-containing protein n=1 Tax=Phakopsora pachyrhizi TaxID=170000 RepID=A0AAV0BPW7_PHAPC|nr:ATP11 protein-domain-containing protein [Phakopsora pachyrhizi]CAH7689413.1 ATP11 protein-domain-containing protein [Phakopsora pachyrhizi]